MGLFDPSASVISGLVTQTLSRRILKSSTFCGMMVGSTMRFSSTIFCSSFLTKLLKDSMLDATNEFSSKNLRMRISSWRSVMADPPVECCLFRSRACAGDFHDVSDLQIEAFKSGIIKEDGREFFCRDLVALKQFFGFLLVAFCVLWHQCVLSCCHLLGVLMSRRGFEPPTPWLLAESLWLSIKAKCSSRLSYRPMGA